MAFRITTDAWTALNRELQQYSQSQTSGNISSPEAPPFAGCTPTRGPTEHRSPSVTDFPIRGEAGALARNGAGAFAY